MQNIRNFIMFLRLKRLNLNHIKNWIQWKLHVFGDNSLKGRCVLRNRLWHQNVTSITLSFEQKLQCTLFFSNSIHCVIDSSLNNSILPMIPLDMFCTSSLVNDYSKMVYINAHFTLLYFQKLEKYLLQY